jgi:hypothetical protein
MLFRRKGRNGGAALAEPPSASETESAGELLAEVARLSEANRGARDPEVERRLIELRHRAGIRLVDDPAPDPRHPAPDATALPEAEGLPDVAAADLTPELLRAGILRDGSVLVRGLIDRDEALGLAGEIDRAFAERERADAGEAPAPGYYQEFEPDPRFSVPLSRGWIAQGGGVLAVDSPKLAFATLDAFERAGLDDVIRGYLGEPVALSAQKTTLRKADPSVAGAWHQDGNFMGEVRALNVWVSLSRCGDEAPGLDIVPRRLDGLVEAGTEGAMLSYTITDENARKAAGDAPIVRPIFEPGDALLFDELCLHQTGSDPSMPNPRYAIESWFFGASALPEDYAPIAV